MNISSNLENANELFHKSFHLASSFTIDWNRCAFLIIDSENLSIFEETAEIRGRRNCISYKYQTALYNTLKCACHLLVTIFNIKNIDKNEATRDYKLLVSQFDEVREELEDNPVAFGLSDSDLARTIISTLSQVQNILQENDSNLLLDSGLKKIRDVIAHPIEIFLRAAIRSSLESLNSCIISAINSLETRKDLIIAVCGSHSSRAGNAVMQYIKLVFKAEEGKGLFYVADIADHEQVIEYVQVNLWESQLGQLIYNDPGRLHKDVLSQVTAEFLKNVKFGHCSMSAELDDGLCGFKKWKYANLL